MTIERKSQHDPRETSCSCEEGLVQEGFEETVGATPNETNLASGRHIEGQDKKLSPAIFFSRCHVGEMDSEDAPKLDRQHCRS